MSCHTYTGKKTEHFHIGAQAAISEFYIKPIDISSENLGVQPKIRWLWVTGPLVVFFPACFTLFFGQIVWANSVDPDQPLSLVLASLGAWSDACLNWWSRGHRFSPCWVWQYSFMEIDHEIVSYVILSLLLIQERQLSILVKECAQIWQVLVNHLRGLSLPRKSVLAKLTSLTWPY